MAGQITRSPAQSEGISSCRSSPKTRRGRINAVHQTRAATCKNSHQQHTTRANTTRRRGAAAITKNRTRTMSNTSTVIAGVEGIFQRWGPRIERVVVVMATSAEAAPAVPRVSLEGVTTHAACTGTPVQARETVWLNPPSGLTTSMRFVS
jgi:hypothetical protein